MKKSSISLFNYLSYSEMLALTKEVRETIAPTSGIVTKQFTSTDLWNIQKQVKYRANRRFL